MKRSVASSDTPAWLMLLAAIVTGVVFVAVAANTISGVMEQRRPGLAAKANPLNVDAYIARLARALENPAEDTNWDRLEGMARKVIRYAPLDARGYALLGQVEALQGDIERADALFGHALKVSDTNLMALRWDLHRAVEMEDAPRAARALQVMTLRWPDVWAEATPQVVSVLQLPDGVAEVAKAFRDDTRQRKSLLVALRSSPETIALASQLLLRLSSDGAPALGPEIGRTLTMMMANQQVAAAQSLFLFTLTPRERQHLGYVFDPRFEKDVEKGPFGWNLKAKSGVSIVRGGEAGRGLEVKFLDAPARLRTVSQTLVLPSGTYLLSVDASAEGLQTAAPLFVELRCNTGAATPIASVELGGGSYEGESFDAGFDIDSQACPVQIIDLTNRTNELDWKQTNSGSLFLHRVTVSKAGAS